MGYRLYDETDPFKKLWRELVEDLRGLVVNDGRDHRELAALTCLSPQTIKRFAEDKTQNPQLHTIVRLSQEVRGGRTAMGAKFRELANLIEQGDVVSSSGKAIRLVASR